MKGVIFTEFIEMVEDRFSTDMVDDILQDAKVPSGGAYTAVGTYAHEERVALVVALSHRTGLATTELQKIFGAHLFDRFFLLYPSFFQGSSDALEFLSGVEKIIHAEVLKLYPDAELPRFNVEHHDAQTLVLRYQSSRHFENLAEGLIRGALVHFGGTFTLIRESIGEGDARQERFSIRRA